MTTVVHPGYVRAAELLPLPRRERVRPDQAEGRECVWCDQPPTIDLGPRISAHEGGLHRWRPGACRACAGREAARVLNIHVTNCQRCRAGGCSDARALHQLATGP